MADQTPIMPPAAFEVSRNSHFGAHFCTHLMPALAAYTVAERDLEDVAGGYDPAYLRYEVEANEAREALTTTLIENLLVSTDLPTDRPLRRMVMLIDALVPAEDVGTFRGGCTGRCTILFRGISSRRTRDAWRSRSMSCWSMR